MEKPTIKLLDLTEGIFGYFFEKSTEIDGREIEREKEIEQKRKRRLEKGI